MTTEDEANHEPDSEGAKWSAWRLLIIGGVTIVVMAVIILIILASGTEVTGPEARANVLATSSNECVACHRNATPGIVDQYGHSTMAVANVACEDCHEVAADYPGAKAHKGTWILGTPTTAMCQQCHPAEVDQYYASRHALPAFVAMAGATTFTEDLVAQYEAIPEGGFAPDKERNAIFALEGPAMTRFTCEGCHNIGRPAADGSVGECQQCHLRHEFSLEQARKPETCNACHIGPDHPQWEIYEESPHGIAYHTSGDQWNWDVEAGTATVADFPAPTCAICHMSGFGANGTTHDVGERLTWYLFSSVSEQRPNADSNRVRMQSVCFECHNTTFIDEFYSAADAATGRVNEWVLESREIIQPLKDNNLLTPEAFDEPIDFTFFNLWHHWGRTAKFGAWMQGPDYSQWHGAYEVLHDLAELKEMVADKLAEAGLEG